MQRRPLTGARKTSQRRWRTRRGGVSAPTAPTAELCPHSRTVHTAEAPLRRLRDVLTTGGRARPIPCDVALDGSEIVGIVVTQTDTALHSRDGTSSQLSAEEALHAAILDVLAFLRSLSDESSCGVYERLVHVYHKYPLVIAALQEVYPTLSDETHSTELALLQTPSHSTPQRFDGYGPSIDAVSLPSHAFMPGSPDMVSSLCVCVKRV